MTSWQSSIRRPLVLAMHAFVGVVPCACGAGGATPVPDFSEGNPVSCSPQEIQDWCWAAAVEVVVDRYLDQPPTQCEVVSQAIECDCCQTPQVCAATCLDTPSSAATIQQALFDWAELESSQAGPLSLQQLVDEIDAGRVLIARLTGSFDGHWVVMHGYDLASDKVYICDPAHGRVVVHFGLTYSYRGVDETWTQTIVGIHP